MAMSDERRTRIVRLRPEGQQVVLDRPTRTVGTLTARPTPTPRPKPQKDAPA
jgi:hypothetical protein